VVEVMSNGIAARGALFKAPHALSRILPPQHGSAGRMAPDKSAPNLVKIPLLRTIDVCKLCN